MKHLSSYLAHHRYTVISLSPLRLILDSFWSYLHLSHINHISTTSHLFISASLYFLKIKLQQFFYVLTKCNIFSSFSNAIGQNKFPNFFHIFKDFIYLFLERGRDREREKNINVWLPLGHPLLGTWPATQACALMGNQTRDPLVHRPALYPLRHTSQGYI